MDRHCSTVGRLAWCIALVTVVLVTSVQAAPSSTTISDAQLAAIANGVAARRDTMLNKEIEKPFPAIDANDAKTAVIARLNFAAAALAAGSPADVDRANDELAAALQAIPRSDKFKGKTASFVAGSPANDDDFHFQQAQFLFRIVRAFGATGSVRKGVLSTPNEQAIGAIFTSWAATECAVQPEEAREDASGVWGSENNDLLRESACWAALSLASHGSGPGDRAASQRAGWEHVIARKLAAIGRGGSFVEYFSPTYSQYSLISLYLFSDFSTDADVRRLARANLDLWWALWAQEQIDGIHGGSKARAYQRTLPTGAPMRLTGWLYFALGPEPRSVGPGEMDVLLSGYRPPEVVLDLAVDRIGRGTYDVANMAPGLVHAAAGPKDWYNLDRTSSPIRRFAHVTPSYIMSSADIPDLPDQKWAAISSQNRWDEIVFAGGDLGARIVFYGFSPKEEKVYNGIVSAQDDSVLLAGPSHYPKPGDAALSIWIGPKLSVAQAGDRTIVSTKDAFVALRAVSGTLSLQTGKNVIPASADGVAVQAGERSTFESVGAFTQSLQSVAIVADEASVSATKAGGPALTLPVRQDRSLAAGTAAIHDGLCYRSPFVNDDAAGHVVVSKGKRRLVLDFTYGDS